MFWVPVLERLTPSCFRKNMKFKKQAFVFAWGVIWRLNAAGVLFIFLGWLLKSNAVHLIFPMFLILNAVALISSINIIWTTRDSNNEGKSDSAVE
jgi:hypothetical protein